LYYKISIFF